MEGLSVCGWNLEDTSNSTFQKAVKTRNRQKFTVKNCREDAPPRSATSTAYALLGVQPACSAAELKAPFRAIVKQFHPDVNRNGKDADIMIRRVTQAYEAKMISTRNFRLEIYMINEKNDCTAPFSLKQA